VEPERVIFLVAESKVKIMTAALETVRTLTPWAAVTVAAVRVEKTRLAGVRSVKPSVSLR